MGQIFSWHHENDNCTSHLSSTLKSSLTEAEMKNTPSSLTFFQARHGLSILDCLSPGE